jgi:tRNA U54 and U55 pseudouridine synthase Pus10
MPSICGTRPARKRAMTVEQMALKDLREDLISGMDGRARPAVSEAEVAQCCCPEMCMRDHENE